MLDFYNKVVKLPLTIKRLLSYNKLEKEIYQYFKTIPKNSKPSTDVILVQTVENLCYYTLFGLIITSLSKRKPVKTEQFVLNSLRLGESTSFIKFIILRFFNGLLTKKWVRLYSVFCDGVGYSSAGFKSPINDVMDFFRAYKCWRAMATKDALIKLTIEGVPIGDLVNDTFMRFKPAPTVNLKDKYLLIVIWQAYRDVRRAKKYFENTKPKLYLTSYTTYIQHGIALRVALMNGVRVFSLSNYQELAKELTLRDWFHTQNPDYYAKNFIQLAGLENKVQLADIALKTRISGGIDGVTAYMKQSAYAKTNEPVPDVKGALIIFLHDFYDSPHVYKDMVFPDFWEWICFTIETLSAAKIKFFIKPHPNQIDLSDIVLAELKKQYPSINIMSTKVSNKQLVDAGMACAVTVYGTIAHEMAYMGVPTIASAHHPHISFDFCKTAKNKTEYAELLRRFNQFNLDKAEMKRQSLIFYYMHNLNFTSDEKLLMDAVINLHQIYGNVEIDQTNVQVDLLDEIANSPAFNAFIDKLN